MMNRYHLLILCLFLSSLATADVLRLSEPVQVTDSYEVFGSPMESTDEGMSLSDLLTGQEQFDGQTVRVTTRIGKVCQKKGCFFIAYEGSQSARVSFVDYSFFVPTDSAGKPVTLVGTFSRSAVTPEQAAHYAEDLGEPAGAASVSDFRYAIVASSVLIPES